MMIVSMYFLSSSSLFRGGVVRVGETKCSNDDDDDDDDDNSSS
jgi:hypothetical protein